MKVIIINGHGGAGKDQFITYFTEYAGRDYVLNISTVDYIKKVAIDLGWDKYKDDLSRKYLSLLKDMATYWGDIPFYDVCHKTNIFYDELLSYGVEQKGFVFIHCREPKEIERLVESLGIRYPTYSLLIRRPTDKIYGNHADDEVENYKYDYIINNDSNLDDLNLKAKKFYNMLTQE